MLKFGVYILSLKSSIFGLEQLANYYGNSTKENVRRIKSDNIIILTNQKID
jgi:hypothetical protein